MQSETIETLKNSVKGLIRRREGLDQQISDEKQSLAHNEKQREVLNIKIGALLDDLGIDESDL